MVLKKWLVSARKWSGHLSKFQMIDLGESVAVQGEHDGVERVGV